MIHSTGLFLVVLLAGIACSSAEEYVVETQMGPDDGSWKQVVGGLTFDLTIPGKKHPKRGRIFNPEAKEDNGSSRLIPGDVYTNRFKLDVPIEQIKSVTMMYASMRAVRRIRVEKMTLTSGGNSRSFCIKPGQMLFIMDQVLMHEC